MKNNVIGVVLCGGQSRRMGRDKGLMPIEGMNWILNAKKKLESVVPFTVISLRRQQWNNHLEYQKIFTQKDVFDDLHLEGPLAGILSVHNKYPDYSLLILACDNVLVDTGLLQRLLDKYKQSKHIKGVLYERNDHWEPLIAVYSRQWLSHVFMCYQKNNDFSYRIKDHIQAKDFVFLNLSEKENGRLDNFNCLQDMTRT